LGHEQNKTIPDVSLPANTIDCLTGGTGDGGTKCHSCVIYHRKSLEHIRQRKLNFFVIQPT